MLISFLLFHRVHDVEVKYYADGEDAYGMRKMLREPTEEERKVMDRAKKAA